METLFLFCAVVGGTVFVLQFVMTLIGFGAEELDFGDDIPDDIDVEGGDDIGEVINHGSTWLFGVISFRTVIAALAFFGLSGYGMLKNGQSTPAAFTVAVMCGAAAMYGVHWMMLMMYRLGEDSTERIERAIGCRGTVYLPIPGDNTGAGKIHLKLQGRLVEYAAMTGRTDGLPTGARVVVTRIVTPTTVEVELVTEQAATADVS